MKRGLFILAVLLFGAANVAGETDSLKFRETSLIDGVVWVVGDEAILRSDVEQERVRARYEGGKTAGDEYCSIPEQIALQKLFIHQAKIDSIEVNNGQVEMQVNAQMAFYLREIGSKEKLEEYFSKTIAEIKDEMKQAFADQSLMQQVQQSLVENINATPSDIKKYYNRLNEDSIPMIPAQVEIQVITLEPMIPQSAIEATKDRLREFADRVNSGKTDFSMLARLYSDDTETAKRGGELGFVGKGALVPEFANVAFSLTEPGKVSRIVETEFGFHIIQLIEKRDDRINCRHILLRPRATAEDKVASLRQLDSIASDIRSGKVPFEVAAQMFSSDKDSKLNGGLMVNPQDGSSKFEYQNLPSEIAKKVYDMKVGEISDAFPMFSEKLNHEIYAIVRVVEKIPNHKANAKDDFQLLKNMCEGEMKQKQLEDWIKNKIRETYIYISPEWRDCEYHYKEWVK